MHRLKIHTRFFDLTEGPKEHDVDVIGSDIGLILDEFFFMMAADIRRLWENKGVVIVAPEQKDLTVGRVILVSQLVNNRCSITVIEDSKFVEAVEYTHSWSEE